MLGDIEGIIFFIPFLYLAIYLAAAVIMSRLYP